MKIAVYTIAKNEEQFIQRWAESCAEADCRLILDTGSTDGSHAAYERTFVGWESKAVVATKTFNPWRFDHARNHALSLLPEDIDLCIALDMDEVLQPGWRQALETFLADNPTVNRPRYKYIWSWNEDGSEGLVYGGDKIHSRSDYTWKHPVHEVLVPLNGERQGFVPGLEIHHHPDHSKSRAQYLPLLELAVEEDPRDDRNQFYLAREYFFNGQLEKAQYHFSQHLKLSMWHPERAASHRYMAKMRPEARHYHLFKAIAEDSRRRESWVDLAKHYYDIKDWTGCYHVCHIALSITEKPLDYLCEAEAWGWLPHDLLAISAYHLGKTDEAFEHGAIAVSLAPNDERLQANLSWYRL